MRAETRKGCREEPGRLRLCRRALVGGRLVLPWALGPSPGLSELTAPCPQPKLGQPPARTTAQNCFSFLNWADSLSEAQELNYNQGDAERDKDNINCTPGERAPISPAPNSHGAEGTHVTSKQGRGPLVPTTAFSLPGWSPSSSVWFKGRGQCGKAVLS